MASFKIDPNHSSIGFSAKHLMVTTVRGRFSEFEGEIDVDENLEPTTARGSFTIQAASVTTNNEQRDGHLKSPDFFDAASYPELTFKTTGVTKDGDGYKIAGDLSIRGTTRPITLEAVVEEPFSDPFGMQRVGLEATSEINRYDWGLNWNQTLEAGRLLVSPKIKLVIEAAFVRPVPAAETETAAQTA